MLLKNRLFSSLASSLEWFDFALYGFFGPVFAKIFFSQAGQSKWVALMVTYAIFAAGFAARPIGGLIFGYLGDKYGRLIPLRLTPVFITLTTASIALFPSYQSIGVCATILLLANRILQGLFLGGEFAGNIVYLCESSKRWKYFWGSIGSCAGSFGILLASTVASIFYASFSQDFLYCYGWRIAFLLSVPLGILALLMRLNMAESPEFTESKSINPLMISLRLYKQLLFFCLGLIYLHSTSFYFVFMFFPIVLTTIQHLSESAALMNNAGFLILHLLFIPIFGLIVNRIGGLKSMVYIALIFSLTTIPVFYWVVFGTKNESLVGLLIFSVTTAFNAAIIPGLLSTLIPAQVRYTILALAFNLGFGVFGGMMPFLGLLLIRSTGSTMSPAIYLTFVSVVTLAFSLFIFKSRSYDEARKIRSTGQSSIKRVFS